MQSFGFAYPAEVHLCGLEALMTQSRLGDDLKGHPVPPRIGGRMERPLGEHVSLHTIVLGARIAVPG